MTVFLGKYLIKKAANIVNPFFCFIYCFLRCINHIPIPHTKIIKLFKGDRYRSKLLEYLSIGSYQRAIQKKGLKGSWVSTKSKTVLDYNKDQLCGKNFTTNGYINLMHLIINTYNKKLYKVQNKNLPIKFFNGGDDPVLVNEKLQKQRIDFLKEIGYKNVSEKVYPGLRHEILNEVDNQIVYKDILDYIKNSYN